MGIEESANKRSSRFSTWAILHDAEKVGGCRKLPIVSGEPAGTQTQGPRLKSSKRPKSIWLDFAKVSPFFLCEQGLEMILYIPLIL